jgi:hypothetical protein
MRAHHSVIARRGRDVTIPESFLCPLNPSFANWVLLIIRIATRPSSGESLTLIRRTPKRRLSGKKGSSPETAARVYAEREQHPAAGGPRRPASHPISRQQGSGANHETSAARDRSRGRTTAATRRAMRRGFLIAGSDICARLLLPIPERPKQKRDVRRVHACGVCARVIGVVSRRPCTRLLRRG